jgi:predicted MFS family arabinose efflux permease
VRVVLRPYRDLLATPGGLAFSSAGFVARMPISMIGLGIVLLVAAHSGRYGLAGLLSATFALVNAVSAPLIARVVDRVGQRAVLGPAVGLHAVFLLGFVGLAAADAPTWTLFVTAGGAGLCAPSIGSMVRARWGHVLGGGPRLQTAYSFESVVDELIFVLGPLLVTLLATRVAEEAGLLVALALLVVGSAALAAQRASEPPPAPAHEHSRRSALRSPGVPLVVVVMFFIGGVFGGVEISAVAFADQIGRKALAGPLLACYAAGSMVAGLVYGVVHWKAPLTRRLLIGASVMTATVAALPFIGDAAVLAPFLFVAGLGIAPTLISGLSLVERMVPQGKVTEGLTWATTGIVVGFSLASPVAGWLVDEVGAGKAFLVGLMSGTAAVLACAVGYRRLHARDRARAADAA